MDFDLRLLQKEQKKILEFLKYQCERESITYYLAYGTCLGSVRHKGFIPWDDDIDIIMPREDYNKFLEVMKDYDGDFFFQDKKTDPQYGLPIGRLRNSSTTLIEEEFLDRDINHGVYVDIYPIFNCPSNRWLHKYFLFFSYIYRLFILGEGTKNRSRLVNFVSRVCVSLSPKSVKEKFIRFFEEKVLNFPFSGFYSTYYGNDAGVMYNSDTFGFPKIGIFEGGEYPLPARSHDFLTSMYGDYMVIPSKEDQKIHHNYIFVDLERPYSDYSGDKYLTNKDS